MSNKKLFKNNSIKMNFLIKSHLQEIFLAFLSFFIFSFFILSLFLFYFSANLYGNNYQSSNEERILFFSSAITILENGQINIHETIVVECLNLEIKHGIYRDLPLYENTKSFFPKPLGLKIIEGRLDTNPAIFKKEKKNGYLRIYLGDPDTYIEKGIHTFEIIYSYDSIIKSLEGEELLYLNITGNNWNFPILKSTATIVFPKNIVLNPQFSFTTIEAYTGAIGETNKNYTFNYLNTNDTNNTNSSNKKNDTNTANKTNTANASIKDSKLADTLFFETTDILQKQEGFTVFIKWKTALFILQQNESANKANYALKQVESFYNSNPSAFILFFGTIVIFIYYLIAWAAVGRDPKKMKLPPSTNIIEQLSPAAIRYIWKMGFDNQCLSTAIISMASKGYLTLEFLKNGFKLKKSENEVNLSIDEKEISDLIFDNENKTYSFTKDNYIKNLMVIQTLKRNLTKNYKNIYFVTNSIYYIIGLIASILIFAVSMIGVVASFEAGFLLLWLTIWTGGVYGLISSSINAWKTRKISGTSNAVILTIFSIPFIAAELIVLTFFLSMTDSKFLLLNLIFAVFLIVINIIYFKLLKRPTKEGVAIYEEIEALKRFLLDIPKDLQNQNKELNLQLDIDKLLPYALALDMENDWFSSILEPSSNSDSNYYGYTYYHSATFVPWLQINNSSNIKNFSDIKSFFYYLNSSIASNSSNSSSSSSSSSGGSSGGGSGGGGGGGW